MLIKAKYQACVSQMETGYLVVVWIVMSKCGMQAVKIQGLRCVSLLDRKVVAKVLHTVPKTFECFPWGVSVQVSIDTYDMLIANTLTAP